MTLKEALLLFALLQVTSSESSVVKGECSTVQYLELGRAGIIHCAFSENLLAITWYDVDEGKPILFYKNGKKSGDGYGTGEFDIHPNGSLVIRNVTLEHESVFRVTKVITGTDPTISYEITVHTTVKPDVDTPVLNRCTEIQGNACLTSVRDRLTLTCTVRDSRPAVKLNWKQRMVDQDRNISSVYTISTDNNITFTSEVSTTLQLHETNFLTLLVCQASDVPLNFINEEKIVLVENERDYTSIVSPTPKFIKNHSSMKLQCSDTRYNQFVWKRFRDEENIYEVLAVSIFNGTRNAKIKHEPYQIDSDGSLSLQNTTVGDEGRYSCVYDDGNRGGIKVYDMFVIVEPVPNYLLVEGCNHLTNCMLEKSAQGDLTCKVRGIRPLVSLEWRATDEAIAIEFIEQEKTVKQNGDLFDVDVVVKFKILSDSQKKITVECVAVGKYSELFNLSTAVDLSPEVSPEDDRVVIPFVLIAVVFIVILVIILALVIYVIVRRKRKKRFVADTEEENVPMIRSNKVLSEQEAVFIRQLKAKYELLYDSVQPIPYIKDRMYCVDEVFVEGGIRFLKEKSIGGDTYSSWENLLSYKDVVSDKCLKNKRQIIEGEPGYGKSTLMLQLVYDWCKSVNTPPLLNTDIVIYLRLRQLGGVKSIYRAIKQFVLPKDSELSEEDIKEMLNKSESVLVLLDGLDEYPDQGEEDTDMHHILTKNMFQEIDVIITNRPSSMPKEFAPKSNLCKLTGFSRESRIKYIRKAVAGGDEKAVDKIMKKLHKNPVLDDLCQVPLFFVMFAHMTHENEKLETFKSVTNYFRYMISCFHSHMIKKMKDENVRKFGIMEHDHKALDKIAYESLSGENQKIVWDIELLRNQLGNDFYNQYLQIGILVEEEEKLEHKGDVYGTTYKSDVRFYHKLFCEWYAAHHVAGEISCNNVDSVTCMLQNLDPFDLQYVYRFACGINKDAADKIIHYLQSREDGKKFAILCMLEQEERTSNFISRVSTLVSSGVTSIRKDESKLLQRSTLQILDVASKNQIPVSCLSLEKSFIRVDQNEISLESELIVPPLTSLEALEVKTERGREFTNDETQGLISYAKQCKKLKRLSLVDCLLPVSFAKEKLSSTDNPIHFKVFWKPSSYGFLFDPSNEKWKLISNMSSKLSSEDRSRLSQLCSEQVVVKRDDSKHRQEYQLLLLQSAASHNISIYDLKLEMAFSSIGEDGTMILQSHLALPILSSLEMMVIQTEEGRIVTQEEFTGLFNCVVHSQRFKELQFVGCQLPSSVSRGSMLSTLASKKISVYCLPGGKGERYYKLNTESGHWLLDHGTSLHSQEY